MIEIIEKIYTENKDKKIKKGEIKSIISFLNLEGKMKKNEIKSIYTKSGLAGLLILSELKKFELNLENI